jgi:hypothetical protein
MKQKVNVALSTPWRHKLGVHVSLNSFLTSALNEDNQHHAPAALPPAKAAGTHWVWVWGGSQKKFFAPTGIRTPTVQPVASALYRLHYDKKQNISTAADLCL